MSVNPVQKDEQKLSQAVADLQKDEQLAKLSIDAAVKNKEKTIAQARIDAADLLEKAKSKAQEQKNNLLSKAEHSTAQACKAIIEESRAEAKGLKDRLSGKIPVAASKITASVLESYN
ncbi:hypothetical protein HY993_04400 [Candidatus Micrarchaeota archaeon]|nr:hypothetical protein [Candidatus Micrarchaeota archaeon]